MSAQLFAPPVCYKVNGVYPDSVRRRVIVKMIDIAESHAYDGNGSIAYDGNGSSYRFTPKDYLAICTDEYTGQQICSPRRAREWYRCALLGEWSGTTVQRHNGPRKRFTVEIEQVLRELVQTFPTATKYQYENWLFNATGEQFHPDSITRHLNRMKLTVKCISYEKRAKFSDENIAYYHEWVDIYKKTDKKRLIFCDASGFNRYNFHAKKGRSRRGERLFSADQRSPGRRINVTGMLAADPDRTALYFALTRETNTYESWLECVSNAFYDGFLREGDILIVDNWSGYVGRNTGELLANILLDEGIFVWPLPKYSPELNAIELLWHWVKRDLEKLEIPETEDDMMQLLYETFSQITDVSKFIEHVSNYIFQFTR
jgi:transposase